MRRMQQQLPRRQRSQTTRDMQCRHQVTTFHADATTEQNVHATPAHGMKPARNGSARTARITHLLSLSDGASTYISITESLVVGAAPSSASLRRRPPHNHTLGTASTFTPATPRHNQRNTPLSTTTSIRRQQQFRCNHDAPQAPVDAAHDSATAHGVHAAR